MPSDGDGSIHAKLDALRDLIGFTDRQSQQRLELVQATINGRLDLAEANTRAVLERVTKLESANSWVLRTIGASVIGLIITAVWLLGRTP